MTRMQKYPKVDATAFASAAAPFTKTEPARPLPSTLDERAHNVEITTQAIADAIAAAERGAK